MLKMIYCPLPLILIHIDCKFVLHLQTFNPGLVARYFYQQLLSPIKLNEQTILENLVAASEY